MSPSQSGPIVLDPKAVGSYFDEVNASIACLTEAMAKAGKGSAPAAGTQSDSIVAKIGAPSHQDAAAEDADGWGSTSAGLGTGGAKTGDDEMAGVTGQQPGAQTGNMVTAAALAPEEMAARLQQLAAIRDVLQAAQDRVQKRLAASTLAAGPGFIASPGAEHPVDPSSGSTGGTTRVSSGTKALVRGSTGASSKKGVSRDSATGSGSSTRVSGGGDATAAAAILEDQLAAMAAAMSAAQQQWAAAQLRFTSAAHMTLATNSPMGSGSNAPEQDPCAEVQDPLSDSPLPALTGLLQQLSQAGDALTTACAAAGAAVMGPFAGTQLGEGLLPGKLLLPGLNVGSRNSTSGSGSASGSGEDLPVKGGAGANSGTTRGSSGAGAGARPNSRSTTPGRAPSVGRGGFARVAGASTADGSRPLIGTAATASGRFTSPGASSSVSPGRGHRRGSSVGSGGGGGGGGLAAAAPASAAASAAATTQVPGSGASGDGVDSSPAQMAAAFDALAAAAARMRQLLDTLCGMVCMAQRMLCAQQEVGEGGEQSPSLALVSGLSGIAGDLRAGVVQHVAGVLQALQAMRAELEGGGSSSSNSGSSSSHGTAAAAAAGNASGADGAGAQLGTAPAGSSADAADGDESPAAAGQSLPAPKVCQSGVNMCSVRWASQPHSLRLVSAACFTGAQLMRCAKHAMSIVNCIHGQCTSITYHSSGCISNVEIPRRALAS